MSPAQLHGMAGLPGPEIYDGIEALGLKTDLRGWHSTHPIFRELITRLTIDTFAGVETIVEIGSWKGASAVHMAKTCREVGSAKRTRIICVDTWLGGLDHWLLRDKPGMAVPRLHGYPQLYFQFLHNVKAAGVADMIVPVPLPSLTGADLLRWQGITPQLIYVDGSHEKRDVLADLRTWWPLLAAGGMLFGDDVTFEAVHAAVHEFASDLGLSVGYRDSQFWILHKPA